MKLTKKGHRQIAKIRALKDGGESIESIAHKHGCQTDCILYALCTYSPDNVAGMILHGYAKA